MRAAGLLLAALLAGCLAVTDAGLPPADEAAGGAAAAFSKIHAPAEIVEAVEALAELPGVEVAEIGRSHEGRPLHKVVLGDGPFVLWIVGRHHGNEPTGGEAILLMARLLADPDARVPDDAPSSVRALREHREALLDRLTFVFVPVVNPDGAEAYRRGNALGVDLNRDHFLFTQPEPRALRQAFWEARPDACLDLHNEGLGATDFDAFVPIGPLLEPELEAAMLRDAWLAVREVDAAGGRAGGPNENYRLQDEGPLSAYPWPDAYHPGTHDLFCTSRGAPGWTPEGAIERGGNGDDAHFFAWSTRLHQVTVATAAANWAGLYDGAAPVVVKSDGSPIEVEAPEGAEVVFSLVLRTATPGTDLLTAPATLRVTGPGGVAAEDRPASNRWTATLAFPDAAEGAWRAEADLPPGTEAQLRAYVRPKAPLVEVAREDGALVARAAADAPGPVHLVLTDVADALPDAAAVQPAPAEARLLEGTVGKRALLEWRATLAPGDELRVTTGALPGAGPWRFTAQAGGAVHAGVEDARNDG